MGNGNNDSNTPPVDLYVEMTKRKDWFFECQLRRLYLESFRDVEENDPNAKFLLNLISKLDISSPPPGSQKKNATQVYLDSEQPVRTREEREQRFAFKDISTGSYGSWLDYGEAAKLAEKLAHLKALYEASEFGSSLDFILELNTYGREDPTIKNIKEDDNKDHDNLSHAISRAAICETKPWLIPEIFNNCGIAWKDLDKWIENGETFIGNYEYELNEVLGGDKSPAFSLEKQDDYRNWIKNILERSLNPRLPDGSKKPNLTIVEFMNPSNEPWLFNIKILTPTYQPLQDLSNYTHSDSVKYWIDACNSKLKEIYVNKSESDMGLCLVMRALYLYGTLDSKAFEGKDIRWRNRNKLLDNYSSSFFDFFDQQAQLIEVHPSTILEKDKWKDRIETVKTKLKILLQETGASPRSGSICFSPLAQEIIKQDILGYKFWLDEPYHAYDYHGEEQDKDKPKGINKARKDVGKGDLFAEMEYWSENHYIMFASSEYLAGQLWLEESFQPAKDFLNPEDKTSFGIHSGKERMERGKARVLKWLNNRLLFGWTEFNSSGYYREHLWALLNLVDFALDEEVRKKATIVTDLLLFDVARFLHKGSMGACGGRSQFPSKNCGWDNALGDVIEIMFGTRGVFINKDGESGCSFATSTYKVPDVLLQIAAFPPEKFFIDRSRVSIGFDEAPKYGIDYSKKSDQRDSLFEGFAPKRAKHAKFLSEVNSAITTTHSNYGAWQDDTIFWWSQSAYFNKEVVRNTFKCVETFKLDKCKAFGELKTWYERIAYFIKVKDVLGLALGALGNGLGFAVSAPLFFDDATSNTLEVASDDLSIFFEGSTRSRANIYTYRNRDVMLSSIQNFRTGQLNFQSNVNQSTISTGINVFTTSGFPGFSISDIPFAIGGALAGAFGVYTLGIGAAAGALLGGGIGVGVNRKLVDDSQLGDQGDGPGWWTGYWALPMVVQHESAAIIAYDFHWLQRRLTDVGSHVWFPKMGFDQTQKRRSSAYEDDNSFITDFSLDLKDIPNFGYGPRGYWLFGRKNHKSDSQNPDNDEEGYIGVFSNRSPDWQDKNSDFYSAQIKEMNEKKLEGIEDKISEINDSLNDLQGAQKNIKIEEIKQLFEEAKNHKHTWANPIPIDFFADKDWYAAGKNIWIIQMGNKKEYGSFENFKDKVSNAKVVVDDASNMGCAYHIPKPDGSTEVLSLKYKDEIKLDGNDFQADFYPRFENLFIRGGRVEWGQREYVIEYNGKSLMHDFSNLEQPLRAENDMPSVEEKNTVKGLVIYLKTEDEEMKIFTVATATVNVGCEAVAVDEVIAAGEVDTNNFHDAEWIFFDKPGLLTPDMTIEIKHPPSSDGEDEPEWKMSFSLKALLGNRRLYDCSVSFPGYHFQDERRSTDLIPFTVKVSRWRSWQMVEDTRFDFWQIASQPGWNFYYYNYFDLLAIDSSKRLWHRRSEACPGAGSEWKAVGTTGRSLLFNEPASLCSISTVPENLFLFAINNGELFNCSAFAGEDVSTKQWTKLKVETIPTTIFGLPVPNAAPVPVPLSSQTRIVAKVLPDWQVGVGLYLSGADHNFYSRAAWLPWDSGSWRQIATDSVFTPLVGAAFEVCGGHLFVLDDRRRLWSGAIDASDLKITPAWKQLSEDQTEINNFAVAYKGETFTILLNANQGEIRAAAFSAANNPVIWERVGAANNFLAFANAKLAWAVPREGHLDIFTTGADGKIYTTNWSEQQGWDHDHGWNVIDDEGHHFEGLESAPLVVLNRVSNQLEVLTISSDQQMWKTWWT